MIVMSNKYFNSLDVSQEQHALYLEYVKDIKEIRQQFLSVKGDVYKRQREGKGAVY